MSRRSPLYPSEGDTDVVELAAQLRPSTWGGFRGVEQLVGREELLKEEWGPADCEGDTLSADLSGAAAPQAGGRPRRARSTC